MQGGDYTPSELPYHKSSINAVDVSPDGRWLASASADGSLRLWDLTADDAGSSSQELLSRNGEVTCLAISQDSRTLVAGSNDAVIRTWNLDAFNPTSSMSVLRGHEDRVRSVAISTDNHWLVSASDDGFVRIWNLETETVLSRSTPGAVPVLEPNVASEWLATAKFRSTWSRNTNTLQSIWLRVFRRPIEEHRPHPGFVRKLQIHRSCVRQNADFHALGERGYEFRDLAQQFVGSTAGVAVALCSLSC